MKANNYFEIFVRVAHATNALDVAILIFNLVGVLLAKGGHSHCPHLRILLITPKSKLTGANFLNGFSWKIIFLY